MELGILGIQRIRSEKNKSLELKLQNFALLYTELIADNAVNKHQLSIKIAKLKQELSKSAKSFKVSASMDNALNGIVAALEYIKAYPSDKENNRVLLILNLVFSTQQLNVNR